MKLSIIVPVYNVEPYLRKCVDSLLTQDYSDYEIILVDDGSTDNSPQICDEYVSRVKRGELKVKSIRVIHQSNAGLSAARNSGIQVAKGEYIMFVDSDDYIEPNVLSGLLDQIKREELDVLRFDYQNVRIIKEGQYEVFNPNKTSRYVDVNTDIVDGETYLNTRMGGYGCYAWQFIIKRELALQFMPGILFEDTEWTPRMLLAAKRVNSTPLIVYNYYWREGSITQKFDIAHINKKINSLLKVNITLQSLLSKVHDGRWIEGCMADNVYSILNNVSTYDYKSVPYWIGVIRDNNMLPLRGYKVRKITLLRYKLINLSPRIYCWLRHVRKTCLKK